MVVARTIALLRNHNLVIELRIAKTLVDPEIELIKANATLKDGSILFVNEAVGENWREYSYHWQKDGKMIKRWDNAPHHKDLVNFPHHVHEGNDILPGALGQYYSGSKPITFKSSSESSTTRIW